MRGIWILLFSSFFSFLYPQSVQGEAKKKISPENLEVELIQILPLYPFSGFSYIYKDTSTNISGNLGTYSREEETNNNSNSIYPLGSLSRLVLTLSFYRLEKLGRINLDSPLSPYFPTAQIKDSLITIRHLLESRVGFTFKEDEILFRDDTTILSQETSGELNQILNSLELTDRSHSSVLESVLLMEVLKKVTKQNYIEFVKKEIFKPLGLHLLFEPSKAQKKGMVSYTNFFNSIVKIKTIKYNKSISPAIQVYGSIEDISILIQSILDPSSDFISNENKNRFFTPLTYYEDSEFINYSHGFFKKNLEDSFAFYLRGEGTSGIIQILDNKKSYLVVITNYEAGETIVNLSDSIKSLLKEEGKVSTIVSNNEKLVSLIGVALFSVSLVLLILHAIYINDYFSIDNSFDMGKSTILFRFLGSLFLFLLLLYLRFLFLPSLESFSGFTNRFDSFSINGWKIEIYYGLLSLLFVSFIYLLSHGIILSKINEK